VQGIATGQAMPAKLPNVTKLGNCRPFMSKTRQVIGRISPRGLLRTVDQQVDFPGRKADELNVEIEVNQILEMTAQQIKIPYRLFGQPIGRRSPRPASRNRLGR
jgi:hypothetical protein